MNEPALQIIAISKILVVALYAGLWGYGGMKGKWKRRILGSAVLTGAVFAYAWLSGVINYWLLAMFPALWLASSQGYGADEFWDKVKKRAWFGLSMALCAVIPALVAGQTLMFGVHVLFCVTACVAFGVFNPMPARYEETLLGAIYALIPLYMF